ncbi:MAG: phage holin family protein [Anaerolineales bacterium]|jgi:putative membrane protein|nr:phage holin family protein [Anaerolineales bacterium]
MKLILRWVITALAVAAAAYLLPGIKVSNEPSALTTLAVAAIVLGLVNALIRPLISFLSCGLIILTLGLFTLVINALMLWLTSYVAQNWLGVGFVVQDFWSAFLGAIIISAVSFVLSLGLRDEKEKRPRRQRS